MAGAILGARSLLDIVMPVGTDGSRILAFQLEDGITAAEVLAEVAVALGEVNDEMVARYGGVFFITDQIFTRTRQGESARSMTPLQTEFNEADGVRSDQVGGMLPRKDYQDGMAWSRRYLQRADRFLVQTDVSLIAERWRNRVDLDVLTRAFTNTENAEGSGYDVPWAIGTATNVNFIPPQWMSYIFDSSHTHFLFFDSTQNSTKYKAQDGTTALHISFNDMFDEMSRHLRHHGHTGVLSFLVSDADIDTISSQQGFVPLYQNQVVTGTSNGRPLEVLPGSVAGVPGELFGLYRSSRGYCELRYLERIPTGYAFGTKSYGVNDPRNGLNIRVEPGRGFGLVPDPIVNRSMNPELDKVLFEATHGIGVGQRTNGVAAYLHDSASAYVNPTFTS